MFDPYPREMILINTNDELFLFLDLSTALAAETNRTKQGREDNVVPKERFCNLIQRKRAYKTAFATLSAVTMFTFYPVPAFDLLFLFIYCNVLILLITFQFSTPPPYVYSQLLFVRFFLIWYFGTVFAYETHVGEKINFDERLVKMKKELNFWSGRRLSILGRMAIVKTLVLFKLVYNCSVPDTQTDFAKEVNN